MNWKAGDEANPDMSGFSIGFPVNPYPHILQFTFQDYFHYFHLKLIPELFEHKPDYYSPNYKKYGKCKQDSSN